MQRRTFLEFLGIGSVTLAFPLGYISCNRKIGESALKKTIDFHVKGVTPNPNDTLDLAEGLQFETLIKWGDSISSEDYFGFNNDYLAFMPFDGKTDEGYLWVNHEYINPRFVSGIKSKTDPRTKLQVEQEMYNVGGSILHIKQENGQWKHIRSDKNRRVSGLTPIPINWDEPIRGTKTFQGTLGNCSGGVTPWGTILTCEENYDSCYGERIYRSEVCEPSSLGWENFYENPPEHYGWVVEVNPKTGEAQKHIALGRCAHECATVVELADGRVVVYTGDDAVDECLYKFVSSKPKSLKEGTLYVANLAKGEWVSLDYNSQPALQAEFENQTDVLVHLRRAAKIVGGTPLDRPEDIEVDPINGNVLVSLTNNFPKENYFGSILKIEEKDAAHESLSFKHDTYLAGGEETGFACPDNMAFDHAGNLWITSDISGSVANKPPFESFGNNGLYLVPRSGPQAGQVIPVASAPIDAELTGPYFSPDGKTLFLSVQHPGEKSKSLDELSSNWPEGGNNIPKPSVVCISGLLLEKVQML